MLQPEETSPHRWAWLDGWFEPPWRALITWLTLVALSGWMVGHGGQKMIRMLVVLLSTG
jgi:hypothetical protein